MGRNETLAALAAQVAEIRGKADQLSSSVAACQARLDTETGPVMVLQVGYKQLREKVDEIAKQLADTRSGLDGERPAATRWDTGSPDSLDRQLAELRQWVDGVLRVLYPGYLAALADCWPGHREAVIEMSALRDEYQRIYGGDEAPLADVQWWLERWLPGGLARISTAVTCDKAGCKLQRGGRPGGTRSAADPVTLSFPRGA